MPGAKEETITKLENAINQMQPVSKLIEQGLTPEGILNEILGEENVQILETMDAQFECNCSHEKFLNAIKGLGEAEIEDMIKEDHGAEAVCHFCGNKYHYSEGELQELLDTIKNSRMLMSNKRMFIALFIGKLNVTNESKILHHI